MQQQLTNRFQNIHLPSTFEVSPAPLASVRNIAMQKTPSKQNKTPMQSQVTPKNVSQVIGKATDSKSKLHSQSKEKQALNQTMYQPDYQLNQTLTINATN